MHESFWGTFVIALGVIIISLIFFIQNSIRNDELLYSTLRTVTEAAMADAVDYNTYYEDTGSARVLRIDREAFLESFVRRFSQNASLANTYVIEFYDINEYPPKVSVRVKTTTGKMIGDREYRIKNSAQLDAILEEVEGGVDL